jgi:hypothetical protein
MRLSRVLSALPPCLEKLRKIKVVSVRTPPTFMRTCACFVLVGLITGCGSNSNNPSDQSAFSVHPTETSAAVGGTVTLQATLASVGTTQDVTSQTTWDDSHNHACSTRHHMATACRRFSSDRTQFDTTECDGKRAGDIRL